MTLRLLSERALALKETRLEGAGDQLANLGIYLHTQPSTMGRSLDFIPNWRRWVLKASAVPFQNGMKLTPLNFCSSSVKDTRIRVLGRTEQQTMRSALGCGGYC